MQGASNPLTKTLEALAIGHPRCGVKPRHTHGLASFQSDGFRSNDIWLSGFENPGHGIIKEAEGSGQETAQQPGALPSTNGKTNKVVSAMNNSKAITASTIVMLTGR